MAYTIDGAIAKILEGWGLVLTDVLAELARVKASFPDLNDRISAFEQWLISKVPNAEKLKNTLRGIAADLVSGASGVDADAWRGSV